MIIIAIRIIDFRGDSTDVSAKMSTLIVVWNQGQYSSRRRLFSQRFHQTKPPLNRTTFWTDSEAWLPPQAHHCDRYDPFINVEGNEAGICGKRDITFYNVAVNLLQSVLLDSKLNKMFFGHIDLESIFSDNENK